MLSGIVPFGPGTARAYEIFMFFINFFSMKCKFHLKKNFFQ